MATRWVFTMHNPKRTDKPYTWSGVSMCCYQLERSKNGSYHYQGYVEFSRPKTLLDMKSFHGGMWCRPARGTAEQNVRYCTKEESRVSSSEYFDSLE